MGEEGGAMRLYKNKGVRFMRHHNTEKKIRMLTMRNLAMRSWNGSRGRAVGGVRHIQVGSESGEGGAITTTTEEVGKGSEMQQEKAYSSSPQDQPSEERHVSNDEDKPQPSARFVKQNAERVKASMNTKNV